MQNYGERLAYWYLRLNGFFLVDNFVHHGQPGVNGERSSDADLLGLRLHGGAEHIHGKKLSRDAGVTDLNGTPLNVAVIVQVKTGAASTAGGAFDNPRLRRDLEFLGIPCCVEDVAQRLSGSPFADCGEWRVAKVLIAENPNDDSCVSIAWKDALGFVEARIAEHAERKSADRLFFGDALMQFLAWKHRQEITV